MKAQVKCPERLAIYVERAFSKCISDSEREFMREQLEKICVASKERGDFFIKQWELMPLPCLQRESTFTNFNKFSGNSFGSMNERLVRGESNTNVPFPSQFSSDPLQQPASFQPGQMSSFFTTPSNSFSENLLGKSNNSGVTPTKSAQPVAPISSTSGMLNSIKKVAETEKQMAARSSTSPADMEMIRRLKRLEKFEL